MAGSFVVGITGASGAVYGLRLCEELLRAGCRLTVLASRPGIEVLREETGLVLDGGEAEVRATLCRYLGATDKVLTYYADDNLLAPVASGSAAPDAMIVAPCSMGTLARIAGGISASLLERCADVMLKERRPLLLVPRETPLNEIHLDNMLKLTRMGVRMVPAMPAFYHQPQTLAELVDFVVGKILDSLGIEHTLFRRWGGKEQA